MNSQMIAIKLISHNLEILKSQDRKLKLQSCKPHYTAIDRKCISAGATYTSSANNHYAQNE